MLEGGHAAVLPELRGLSVPGPQAGSLVIVSALDPAQTGCFPISAQTLAPPQTQISVFGGSLPGEVLAYSTLAS